MEDSFRSPTSDDLRSSTVTAVELLSPGMAEPFSRRLKGWIFGFFLLFSAFFGSLFMIAPLIPLIYLRPRLWRLLMDRLVGWWMIWPGLLMKFIWGVEITVWGDLIEHEEPAIIIMNHRTRLDWLFFWNALYKQNPWLCTSLKISMKGILKHIPGAGWAMGSNGFLFLDRRFEEDKHKLDSMINYYSNSGYNYQLLFYPEGTDKCRLASERHRLYSEGRRLPVYEFLLHPRTTGFLHIVKTMRNLNYIKYVYDVTIAYPVDVVQSEIDLILYGKCPSRVHYQVRKIPIGDMPTDDLELVNWLKRLWKEKEDKLRDYLSKPTEQRQLDSDGGASKHETTGSSQALLIFATVYWFFTTLFWIVACLLVPYLLLWLVFSVVLFASIQKVFGGIEWMARDYST